MDLSVSDMMAMQCQLAALHEGEWWSLSPESGHKFLLCMAEELGEVIAVWKKKGDAAIMADPAVRAAFAEEMADILMFWNDVLLCYGVTPQEFSDAYRAKHRHNLGRNYAAEYEEKYHG